MEEKPEKVIPKQSGNVVESLLETLTCPVCLETLRKDSIMCANGHAICRECQGTQVCCPTCREDFIDLKQNAIVRQVLEVISGACRFEGCGHLVKSGDEHESLCCFRQVECKFPECKWTGRAAKLVAHVKEVHLQNLLSEMEKWFGSLSF